MNDIKEKLNELLGIIPSELLRFYQSFLPIQYPDLRINVLEFKESYNYTKSMKGIPLFEKLGLWVLDDANDSNPYCFISKGPCSNAIIHFSHDPEPEIKFSSLDRLLEALAALGDSGNDIDEINKDNDINFDLKNDISILIEEDSDESLTLISLYLPVCKTLSQDIKENLVSNKDFLIRETMARWILANPEIEDLKYAEKLSQDSFPQVASLGKKGKSVINQKKSNS